MDDDVPRPRDARGFEKRRQTLPVLSRLFKIAGAQGIGAGRHKKSFNW